MTAFNNELEFKSGKSGFFVGSDVTIPLRSVANSSDGALPQCKEAKPTL